MHSTPCCDFEIYVLLRMEIRGGSLWRYTDDTDVVMGCQGKEMRNSCSGNITVSEGEARRWLRPFGEEEESKGAAVPTHLA